MAQHTERFVSFRNGKFNVQLVEGGAGDNLLYLHGAGGFTGWDDCLDRLAEEFHVIAPAHPGVARSDGLEHLDDLWDLVLFYEELLDELGLEQTFVVGHSYGGLLAAELAAQCPQRIRRLALVGSLGLWLEDTPVADFFILTRSERERLLWYDGQSEIAQAFMAAPEDPQERMEADLTRTQTLASVGKFVWPIPDKGCPSGPTASPCPRCCCGATPTVWCPPPTAPPSSGCCPTPPCRSSTGAAISPRWNGRMTFLPPSPDFSRTDSLQLTRTQAV